MPTYFPEGDLPKPQDNPMRSLQKLVSIGGGGAAISGVTGAFAGDGDPDPALVPSGTAGTYWDWRNKALWNWNPDTLAWE